MTGSGFPAPGRCSRSLGEVSGDSIRSAGHLVIPFSGTDAFLLNVVWRPDPRSGVSSERRILVFQRQTAERKSPLRGVPCDSGVEPGGRLPREPGAEGEAAVDGTGAMKGDKKPHLRHGRPQRVHHICEPVHLALTGKASKRFALVAC